MLITARSDGISCLLKNTRIIITKDLIRTILKLEECENQFFFHKAHPILEGYNPFSAYHRVMGKNIENSTKLSTNQLILLCKILQNITFHVILPRKNHQDKVNNSASSFLILS